MPVITKVTLSSTEFGETFHIAAAMILTNSLPQSATCYDWKIMYEDFPQTPGNPPPASLAQDTYLKAIANTPTYNDFTGVNGNPTITRNNCTEDIIAPAFSKDTGVVNKTVNCFISESIIDWDTTNGTMFTRIDYFIRTTYPALVEHSPRAIIRIRATPGQNRNMSDKLITQIVNSLVTNTTIKEIIFVGDQLQLPQAPTNVTFHDLRGFLTDPTFINIRFNGKTSSQRGEDYSFAAQLMFFMVLENHFDLKMQIGMMSGALDGPAFIGIPTIFFEEQTGMALASNSRMGKAATSIPWMEQVAFGPNSYDSNNSAKDMMPQATITALDAAINKLK